MHLIQARKIPLMKETGQNGDTTRERVNLIPLVRSVVGNPDTGVEELGKKVQQAVATMMPTLEEHQTQRTELRVLSAIIIEAVMEDFSYIPSFQPDEYPHTMFEAFQEDMRTALNEKMEALFSGPLSSEMKKVIDRYTALYSELFQNKDFAKEMNNSQKPEFFIKRGVGTTVHMMTNLLHITPLVLHSNSAQEWITPQGLSQVAQASLPLLMKMAMLSIQEFTETDFRILESNWFIQLTDFKIPKSYIRWDPKALRLRRKNGDAPQIVLNKEMEEFFRNIAQQLFEKVGSPKDVKTGCPAHVNGSIEKLWNHICINIAPSLYKAVMNGEEQQKALQPQKT